MGTTGERGSRLTGHLRTIALTLLVVQVAALGIAVPAVEGRQRIRSAGMEIWRYAAYPRVGPADRGTNVLILQHLLRAGSPKLDLSSAYDRSTRLAIVHAQKKAGIRATGRADARLWDRLAVPLRRGESGHAVRALQVALTEKLGWGVKVTGTFDKRTFSALRRLQRDVGLRWTGRVDARTWRVLAWHYERPSFGRASLCDYSTVNGPEANWATASVIAWLERAAAIFHRRTGLAIAVGDLSRRFGGRIPGHGTHGRGLEADLRPIRADGRHCAVGGNDWRERGYDRRNTRLLVRALRTAARNRVLFIAFNDPRLRDGKGRARYAPGHNDHLHITWCHPGHRSSLYRCAR